MSIKLTSGTELHLSSRQVSVSGDSRVNFSLCSGVLDTPSWGYCWFTMERWARICSGCGEGGNFWYSFPYGDDKLTLTIKAIFQTLCNAGFADNSLLGKKGVIITVRRYITPRKQVLCNVIEQGKGQPDVVTRSLVHLLSQRLALTCVLLRCDCLRST